MLSTTPTYNLKIVLKETGLPADTLRAWERRYGLPVPQRTEGGHRLYSQYDIETIKWLIARQAEGLSISRAVELWNEYTSTGIDLLANAEPSTQNLPAIYVPRGTTLDTVRAGWIKACMDFNEANSEHILNQALAIFPVEAVCMDVLQRAMSEIGQLWFENKASVQQEHFASALAMRRLDTLLSSSPAPSRAQTVMVGCPANEWHTFTALLLALLLRRRGLNVIYLGANIPSDHFEQTVKSIQVNLVILIAQTLVTAAALHTTAISLSNQRTPIAFGGRIFSVQSNLRQHISGHYLGTTVPSALEEVEKVLKRKPRSNTPNQPSVKYVDALIGFKAKRTHIESTLKGSLPPAAAQGFNTGIEFLGDNIIAALQLGDMNYVNAEMDWIKKLLQAYKRPREELSLFMKAYSSAVDKHINSQGQPIKDWLGTQIK